MPGRASDQFLHQHAANMTPINILSKKSPAALVSYHDTSTEPKSVVAPLIFLQEDEAHEETKPFKLQYDPGQDIPRSNCSYRTDMVPITDLRTLASTFSYEQNGFSILNMTSRLTPEEFYDTKRVETVYYPEAKQLLSDYFGAKRVEVLEHLIRRRHSKFPISTGEDYEHLQPTSIVHVDFTEDSALEASEIILKVDPENYNRVQCVNLWKPLQGPVTDWPLTFCDGTTVQPESDFMEMDVVSRTGFTENYQVYNNKDQRWYYYSGQSDSEIVLFRQADTVPGLPGLPHTSFKNPLALGNERPRESIEMRAFIYT